VNATGISPLSGPFKRQDTASFHLTSTGDRDQDGLPDEWEQRYGTNPSVNDAQADPDNDGSNNAQEWQRGTNPTDSDTDNGGEADGTDTDPLNPADDKIQPTWGVVYPGVGKVFIKYPLRPQYQFVRLFRGTNPKGPFTFLMQNSPGTGVLSDTQVVNGTTYCYIVLALDAQSHFSAGGEPSCTTPKTDPLAPHGWVIINKGARAAGSSTVQLTLWASDAVDPEVATPDDALLLPPADSASGVTQMMISNRGDMKGGVWEPYTTTKTWTLDWTASLPAVFVKYRDAAGNESAVAVATIHLNQLFLPVVHR
jgi:hypothetical protein